MEAQIGSLKDALLNLDMCCKKISEQKEGIETEIHDTFKRLEASLNSKKAEVVAQLQEVTHSKLSMLEAQKTHIEIVLLQQNSCLKLKQSVRWKCY